MPRLPQEIESLIGDFRHGLVDDDRKGQGIPVRFTSGPQPPFFPGFLVKQRFFDRDDQIEAETFFQERSQLVYALVQFKIAGDFALCQAGRDNPQGKGSKGPEFNAMGWITMHDRIVHCRLLAGVDIPSRFMQPQDAELFLVDQVKMAYGESVFQAFEYGGCQSLDVLPIFAEQGVHQLPVVLDEGDLCLNRGGFPLQQVFEQVVQPEELGFCLDLDMFFQNPVPAPHCCKNEQQGHTGAGNQQRQFDIFFGGSHVFELLSSLLQNKQKAES
ncbi:MAG: hypothetical protein ACD_75C01272G0002, partial [uncultured bacterium]